jgi:hypothetical protein
VLTVAYEYEECFTFCTPSDAANDPEECITRAGMPLCFATQIIRGTSTSLAPPLWRGTCASAGFRLFGPQFAFQLGLQGVAVLLLCALELYTGRTLQQALSSMQAWAVQHAKRKACCSCRRYGGTDAYPTERKQAAGPAPGLRHGGLSEALPPVAPLLPSAAASNNQQVGGVQALQVDSAATTGSGSAVMHAPRSESGVQAISGVSSDAEQVDTFQRIEASVALLVGAVYGVVYPAAALMAITVLLSYSLSWHLLPEGVALEPPVPRWMGGVMLVVYTACVWFAYGPGSMLDGESAEGALWVLGVLTVSTVCTVVWLVVYGQRCPTWMCAQVGCGVCQRGLRREGTVQSAQMVECKGESGNTDGRVTDNQAHGDKVTGDRRQRVHRAQSLAAQHQSGAP